MSFNSCNKCGLEFPGPKGASDFINHNCRPALWIWRIYFMNQSVPARASIQEFRSEAEARQEGERAMRRINPASRNLCTLRVSSF